MWTIPNSRVLLRTIAYFKVLLGVFPAFKVLWWTIPSYTDAIVYYSKLLVCYCGLFLVFWVLLWANLSS